MPPAKTMTKKDNIGTLVNAGKALSLDTVDFSQFDRPKTCLEVDFPIVPINRIAAIEGNAGKPIYQISKWWARRRSSVFRAMLIAAATKAPDDVAEAAKTVWSAYYGNHQNKQAFHKLKVADIFMGGGTTLVEGSRLGFQLYGTDLNPVAWFVVKTELSNSKPTEVESLLNDIEHHVKPQIAPFYACRCPRGHNGQWLHIPSEQAQPADFDPFAVSPEKRHEYQYLGPEIIYVFWAKHGPCKMTGCGHRTPIMRTPVIATKTLSIASWIDVTCENCGKDVDVEQDDARIAPDVPLVLSGEDKPFAILDSKFNWQCPFCKKTHHKPNGKPTKRKQVELTLLIHPDWLKGTPPKSPDGLTFGGCAEDPIETTRAWYAERARTLNLIEVRGPLPDEIACPGTNETMKTGREGGTVPEDSTFACQSAHCGATQDQLESIKLSGKMAPVAAYAIQGYCSRCDADGRPYKGRFFIAADDMTSFNAADEEWSLRMNKDLCEYWPKSELPYGFMTTLQNGGIPNHGFTHWWKMFNSRQLLSLSLLLKAITKIGGDRHTSDVRELVLAAFQQHVRNQNMFCIWNVTGDKTEPLFANNNYHPKVNYVENCVFPKLGRGNWQSCTENLVNAMNWSQQPWELLAKSQINESNPDLAKKLSGQSTKVQCLDPVQSKAVSITCGSATNLNSLSNESIDLVITDPPFGGLLHYSELADFFYVWLRLVLKDSYPEYFSSEFTPKALEVVSNRARHEDPQAFYQRLLTESWKEAHRILKPGGILSFTFHHSEDRPWIAVLESLFDAGFYLEATYPIRSDETKGEGSKPGTFGSQKTEYDIVHVCRKRMEEPKRVSWARMRREVVDDIKQLASILEHHRSSGLLPGDLHMIKRGKALEYFSKHYGQVFVNLDSEPFKVEDALLGIDQILDEETGQVVDPPPQNCDPLTRRFLRMFDSQPELKRDQIQKFLKGTTINPKLFVERGWCTEKNKIYHLCTPLEIAQTWQGKYRRSLSNDYDQTMVLIGSCFDQSGINAADTIKNANFRPHPALEPLLDWYSRKGHSTDIRQAALRAARLLRAWQHQNPEQVKQLSIFMGEED